MSKPCRENRQNSWARGDITMRRLQVGVAKIDVRPAQSPERRTDEAGYAIADSIGWVGFTDRGFINLHNVDA